MVRVGVKAQKTILINHCKRVGKTDNVKMAAQIAREKGLIDQKNRVTKIGYTIVSMSNFNEHVSVEPWKDYWSR